jgi:hypothetical protein
LWRMKMRKPQAQATSLRLHGPPTAKTSNQDPSNKLGGGGGRSTRRHAAVTES